MKIKRLLCIFLSSLLCISNTGTADTSKINWLSWSQGTLTQAKNKKRLIFISLTAEWCQFCKKMDITTYRDRAVINELSKHYLAIKADESRHPEIAKRFTNVGFPGTVILNEDGKILLAKTGYLKPQWMLWTLQAIASDANENNG